MSQRTCNHALKLPKDYMGILQMPGTLCVHTERHFIEVFAKFGNNSLKTHLPFLIMNDKAENLHNKNL